MKRTTIFAAAGLWRHRRRPIRRTNAAPCWPGSIDTPRPSPRPARLCGRRWPGCWRPAARSRRRTAMPRAMWKSIASRPTSRAWGLISRPRWSRPGRRWNGRRGRSSASSGNDERPPPTPRGRSRPRTTRHVCPGAIGAGHERPIEGFEVVRRGHRVRHLPPPGDRPRNRVLADGFCPGPEVPCPGQDILTFRSATGDTVSPLPSR